MPRPRARRNPTRNTVIKEHLKYVALSRTARIRYLTAVKKFFAWRKAQALPASAGLDDLDVQVGEYINFLYQEGLPIHWAADTICGFKRFFPRTRRNLDTASLWYKNWCKIIVRVAAMPLHVNLLKAFMVYGLLRKEVDFALSLWTGFLGLLRPSEIFALNLSDCKIFKPDYMQLLLRGTKGSHRSTADFETVVIRDRHAIVAIERQQDVGVPRLFNGTPNHFRMLYRDAASFYMVRHPKPTLHGIRRGGASFHFGRHNSYDRTAEHGRWAHSRTAKLYID